MFRKPTRDMQTRSLNHTVRDSHDGSRLSHLFAQTVFTLLSLPSILRRACKELLVPLAFPQAKLKKSVQGSALVSREARYWRRRRRHTGVSQGSVGKSSELGKKRQGDKGSPKGLGQGTPGEEGMI